jgi:hypothetical protein
MQLTRSLLVSTTLEANQVISWFQSLLFHIRLGPLRLGKVEVPQEAFMAGGCTR